MEHRDDLQGLRAVAVLLVVLGHAGVPFLRGGFVGVDVFFVLSGFLITGILLSRAAEKGYVSLADFYARRARRILPAAALTLVATDLAAYYLLNFVRARQVVLDSVWASLFGANVHFARQGTDYFMQGQPPSPVEQFWTLAVEEQFYVVWPAVLALMLFGTLLGWPLRRPRRRARRGIDDRAIRRLFLLVAAVALASLAWSIGSTASTPESAYFSTLARAWELALGAALALVTSRLARMPASLRVGLGWCGMIAIACAGVLYSATTPFPGSAALLPAAGAAFVIAAGIGGSRVGLGRALSLAPLRYVGDRSYALYLWHWPVLIIAVQYAGHELSSAVKLLLVCGAFGLSIVSYRFFENPIRHARWPAPVGAVLWPASAAVVLVVVFLTLSSIDSTATRFEAAAATVRPVALVEASAVTRPSARRKPLPAVTAAVRAARRGRPLPAPLVPAVSDLRGDFYFLPGQCMAGKGETSIDELCRLGNVGAGRTIVVLGDSHAQMWMPAIMRMAQRDGWAVVPLIKLGCVPDFWILRRRGCGAWYDWAIARAVALRPRVTLIVGSWAGTRNPNAAVAAVGAAIRTMKPYSPSVIVVGDAPLQSRNPADCLLDEGATMRSCATTAPSAQLRVDAAVESDTRRRRVGFMDTRGWFCARAVAKTPFLCPLVINRTIAWVDRGHVGRTYALELVKPFRSGFRRELFR